jgi:D-alanine-D-alanine ligase
MVVPCLLDMLGLPYTGSSALSLALALHKPKAKELLRARGVSTPGFAVVSSLEDVKKVALPFPLIVKPSREDASMGVSIDSVVHDADGLRRVCEAVLRTFQQPALVEQFIAGREIYVPLLGNTPRRALPLTEIRFGAYFQTHPNIVTYKSKWEPDSPDWDNTPTGPAQVDDALHERLVRTAMDAFTALDCQDYGRVDLRVTPEGIPYVIDINPNCDLHPTAGYAKTAASAGMDYPTLANTLVEIALERAHGSPSHRTQGPGAARRPDSAHRNLLQGGDAGRRRAGGSRASAE